MQQKATLVSQNKTYFFTLASTLFLSIVFLLTKESTGFIIFQNTSHPFLLNVFFINYTFMCDGLFAVCCIAFTIFYLKKHSLGKTMFYAFLLSTITVQLIKNIYNQTTTLYFEAGQYLFFTNNTSYDRFVGFPSGHTAIAFALVTVVALLLKNKKWQLPLLAAAILMAYSRLYLSQNSISDVLIGAVIGAVSGLCAVYLLRHPLSIKSAFKKWKYDLTPEQRIPSTHAMMMELQD